MDAGPRRRSGHVEPDGGLNYAAIGATATEEVLSFPPAGFTPEQAHHRIGSGARRFDLASRALMTWGVLRGSGVRVEEVAAETAATESVVVQRGGRDTGALYLEDGTPWVTPGMTATLVLPGRRDDVRAPVKVVWVVDEPGRIGFAYGSRPGHPAQLEQLLLLEHAADDTVWLTARSVARPSGDVPRLVAATYRRRQREVQRRFMTALHPASGAA